MSSQADSVTSFSVSGTTESSRSGFGDHTSDPGHLATLRESRNSDSLGSSNSGSWINVENQPVLAIRTTSDRRASSQPNKGEAQLATKGQGRPKARFPSIPRARMQDVPSVNLDAVSALAKRNDDGQGQADPADPTTSQIMCRSGNLDARTSSVARVAPCSYSRDIPRTPRDNSRVRETPEEWNFLRQYVAERTSVSFHCGPDMTKVMQLTEALHEHERKALAIQQQTAFQWSSSRSDCHDRLRAELEQARDQADR